MFEGNGIPGLSVKALTLAATILFATPALASDPLPCTDNRVLSQIHEHFKNAEQMAPPRRKMVSLNPREVLLGRPPASANRHATATTYIAASRYCEGRAEFDVGQPEPVYWRIDQVRDGADEAPRIDICHKQFDIFEDGCKAFRPGG